MAEQISVDAVEWYRLKQAEMKLWQTQEDMRAVAAFLGDAAKMLNIDIMALVDGRKSISSLISDAGIIAAKSAVGMGPDCKSLLTDDRRQVFERITNIIADEPTRLG